MSTKELIASQRKPHKVLKTYNDVNCFILGIGSLYGNDVRLAVPITSTSTGLNRISLIDFELKDKIDSLKSLFEKEKKALNIIIQEEEFISRKILSAINQIALIDFEKASLELIDRTSIIFKLRIDQNQKAYITFKVDSEKERECYLSIYNNRDCIYNGIGTLEQVVNDIHLV